MLGTESLARVTKAVRAASEGSITLRAAGDTAVVVHPVLVGELIIARMSNVIAASAAMTKVGSA